MAIDLPKTNLELIGSGHDTNGNKIVKLRFFNSKRGFSIQTSGNLRNTGNILRGLKTEKDMEKVNKTDLKKIGSEVVSYIKKNGSENQKNSLKVYK